MLNSRKKQVEAPMKRTVKPIVLLIIISFVVACATVPITGRRQLALVPEATVMSASSQQYEQFLQENPVVRGTEEAAMVERVGRRLAKSVERYLIEQGLEEEAASYRWEFNLIDGKEVNAWAMPGGKVAIYRGILPITQDETGLAVVMGHEIAHVVARHGSERLSQGLLTQLGGLALSTALAQRPEGTRQLWMTAFGAGAQLGVLLPYSRLHESEADRLGLIFMAMAGYDPNRAAAFWERMAQQRTGPSPPEFLSTHPADETRIRNLQDALPEALRYYQPPTPLAPTGPR
jgi:predicted Zn-dependent protease